MVQAPSYEKGIKRSLKGSENITYWVTAHYKTILIFPQTSLVMPEAKRIMHSLKLKED